MIRIDDLREAIAECQGEKNPNANTCIKLAAYYTILDHIEERPQMSFAAAEYQSNTEFGRVIAGVDTDRIMAVMDELMESVEILMPRLYNATLERLKNIM